MRLAISNLAWSPADEPEVADRLPDLGVSGIELACTKVWPHPLAARENDIARVREFWESRGLPIVALQSLLFEKPHLRMFADAGQRAETVAYLRGMIRLGGRLGAGTLVLGSPKNRRIEPRCQSDVWPEAVSLFRELGEFAAECATCLCIEPNPPEYGCDFLTRAEDARQLVIEVNRAGFRLHLDSACMTLAGDEAHETIRRCVPLIRHFHISEPNLAPLGGGTCDHRRFGAALRDAGYDYWVSIEMKSAADIAIDCIEHACAMARASYA